LSKPLAPRSSHERKSAFSLLVFVPKKPNGLFSLFSWADRRKSKPEKGMKGKVEIMLRSYAMTIGQLSRRTSVPIKVLRTYEDLGFLCTRGRSESNYRLFGEEALRCVQTVQSLRSLGLTLKEIQSLVRCSCQRSGEPVEGLLHEYLAQALARIETQISTLQARRQRILEFQATSAGRADRSAASVLVQILAADPHCDA
jgi:DNA-binding transcriptional MerR regulator